MPLPRHFRSISFRVALIYTVFFVGSVLAILGTTYLAASSELGQILRSAISDEMDRVKKAFATGGEDAVFHEMSELLEGPSEDRFFLLARAGGPRLLGNLSEDFWHEGWHEKEFDAGSMDYPADVRASKIPVANGEVLLISLGQRIGPYEVLIGRNSHVLDETQDIILSAMLWGALVTTLLALVGGFFISIGPTKRVDEIAATTRRIVDGHLDVRLPVSKRGDELDRLALDINAMLARIETVLSSLRQVSTDIAHDLRTPLARLRQRLDSVRRITRSPEEYETAIDAAIEESDAAIETFNALLRIAQIEAGTRRQRFRTLDLAAIVVKTCDVYGEVAADAGHTLEWDDLQSAEIEGDEELLVQMLANLLENAINHVPSPGKIAVSIRRASDRICVDVADNGAGVPVKDRQRIFRRLYRLDRSRTTPGNGLGLSLVAAIAELHGGTVQALDNRPGLRIRVAFPVPVVAQNMAG